MSQPETVPTATDEFAAAMQQLSAEAAKKLPIQFDPTAGAKEPLEKLEERMEKLERVLSDSVQKESGAADLLKRFEKIDEQLSAIRNSESVNQQLFDSLHAELRKYRDNFLHESLQQPFIHDLVLLYDDLNGLAAQLHNAADERCGKRGHLAQWRTNLDNAIHSLVEILHRFDVREVEPMERLDRSLHKVVSYEPAEFAEDDGRIVMRVKRGFLWRGKLVRPEEVIAKRFG